MFRRLVLSVVVLTIFAGIGGFVLFGSVGGQDYLLRTGLKPLMGASWEQPEGMRVLVCGSASPLGNSLERAQACIAVITSKHLLVFDVGAGSPLRIAQSRMPVNRLTGVFLTHYHSDHISGLPDLNLASWVRGRAGPLQVYGPPGVTRVVQGFNTAFELDRAYRVAHHGRELLPPENGSMNAITFTPGDVVWQDDELKVTSFAVAHPPIRPAVGYRVDYLGRSIVISGDSNASDSLFEAAQGADLLLHDALSRTLLDPMIETATALGLPVLPKIMEDVIDYHADTLSLPERAKQADIRLLAYYHLVPVPANSLMERMFRRDLPADVIVVEDLHVFDLPPDSSEILVSRL